MCRRELFPPPPGLNGQEESLCLEKDGLFLGQDVGSGRAEGRVARVAFRKELVHPLEIGDPGLALTYGIKVLRVAPLPWKLVC